MRQVISLNQNWFYKSSFSETDLKTTLSSSDLTPITLPHSNIETPYHYFDESIYQFISSYRRKISWQDDWKEKHVFLHFGAVMTAATVYYNDTLIGEHLGGYTPFKVRLPQSFETDKDAIITVKVDSQEREEIPPFGGQIDYLTYGGIYREVSLEVYDPYYISYLAPFTRDVLNKPRLDLEFRLESPLTSEKKVEAILSKEGKEIARKSKIVTLQKGENTGTLTLENLENIDLWDLNNPHLYDLELQIVNHDSLSKRIGFREMNFSPEGFFLNQKRIQIVGLNRHQSFPYVGYAMPPRAQRRDADIMKYELGLNCARSSHYPPSQYFLDRCDEIGLLVFNEIPGWQHIGDKNWQEIAIENTREMIERDIHHPSIYIWGVRINESCDNHDFYFRTNALAKKLDPDRATGGVRCHRGSELLEDVYTMNDFIHSNGYVSWQIEELNGHNMHKEFYGPLSKDQLDTLALREQTFVTKKDDNVPYLITEYNGHMYPTKTFDQEERLIEHALRHARVQNAAFGDPFISGAIGWCFFDYNTHKDFGSGDHICHHGVSDLFRIPKWAAFIYSSQRSPSDAIVLKGLTHWARGERSIGGVIPLVVATNCDYLDFYYGDKKIGRFYPDSERFPHLQHPPIVLRELEGYWGMQWDTGKLIGFVNNEPVATQHFSNNPTPQKLNVKADDTTLSSIDWDTTRIVVQLEDSAGNTLPFTDEIIHVECTGVGSVLGPQTFSLLGGVRGFWLKTNGKVGNINLHIHTHNSKLEAKLSIKVS